MENNIKKIMFMFNLFTFAVEQKLVQIINQLYFTLKSKLIGVPAVAQWDGWLASLQC